MSRTLCAPAAATSNARLARPLAPHVGEIRLVSRRRREIAGRIDRGGFQSAHRPGTPHIGQRRAPRTRCHRTPLRPRRRSPTGGCSVPAPDARAATAIGSAPRMGRRSPSRPSSPTTTVQPRAARARGELLAGDQDAECDGQVERRALLRNVGRSEVHGDAAEGQRVSSVGQRGGDPLLALTHRTLGKADRVEGGQATLMSISTSTR